jgi:hypothetical protein
VRVGVTDGVEVDVGVAVGGRRVAVGFRVAVGDGVSLALGVSVAVGGCRTSVTNPATVLSDEGWVFSLVGRAVVASLIVDVGEGVAGESGVSVACEPSDTGKVPDPARGLLSATLVAISVCFSGEGVVEIDEAGGV